jgi:hypothetical protein
VVFDGKLSGFFVRKFASGKVNYGVKYAIRGRSKKHTLGRAVPGNLQAMRLEASGILAKAHMGIDAVVELKAAAEATARLKPLGELVPIYLAVREKGDEFWRKMRPKSLSEATRYLTKSWAPLHGEPVETITRQQIKARRDEIVHASGAVSGNRARRTAYAALGAARHQAQRRHAHRRVALCAAARDRGDCEPHLGVKGWRGRRLQSRPISGRENRGPW